MIAKGKVFISQDKLKELFNLPDAIEIISISSTEHGLEFNIASRDPVDGLTMAVPNWESMRRVSMPVRQKKELGYCTCDSAWSIKEKGLCMNCHKSQKNK